MTFANQYLRFLAHPMSASAELRSPTGVRWGFYALLIPLLGYLLVYAGLSRSGAYPSSFDPWLAIDREHYYRYNFFLLPPSIIAGWLLASAVVQLTGRWLGARGSFEETCCALGFAISAGSWSLLPHDLTVALLGALGVIDGRAHEHAMNAPTLARHILWFFMALYAVAFPYYFSRAIAGMHGIKTGASWLLGTGGFAVYQLVFLLFNR